LPRSRWRTHHLDFRQCDQTVYGATAQHALRGSRWACDCKDLNRTQLTAKRPGAASGKPLDPSAHTDTVAAVFTCTHCNAVPEQVVDGKATIAIVRHELACPTLMAQTRTRWPARVR
jgi:hypothetical protein